MSVLLSINVSFPQSENIDTMLKKITSEKDDNTRIDLINDLFSSTMESDPLLSMQNAQKLLFQSKKNNDRIAEALALTQIGYSYRSFGNTPKSVEYNLKALALARETGNEKVIAHAKLKLAHNLRSE